MKVLVVDDEGPARERLADLVTDLDGYEVVGCAADGVEALELAECTAPDIVLMDIRMPGMDGIESARHLASLDEPPAVIFTTAYDSYTLEAFEAAAVGYIMKPVRKTRLAEAMQRAARLSRAQLTSLGHRRQAETRRHVAARVGGRLRLIPVEDIRYFRADQKYVSVRHHGGQDLIDEPLKALEEEFAPAFSRIHRNALVALKYVDSVETDESGQLLVRVQDCEEPLTVSRRHAAEFRRRIKSL